MKHIQPETKEAIMKQALGTEDKTLFEVAVDNNIGYSTLRRWVKEARDGKPACKPKSNPSREEINQSIQLNHLLATANLDETALGIYCRQHGIYSHQLTQWKENFMSNTESPKNKKQIEELRKLKAENNDLKKDLRRKEKALAEASALLILKKKADLIWGDKEED